MKGKNNLEIAKKITFLNITDLVNYTLKRKEDQKVLRFLKNIMYAHLSNLRCQL